MTSFLFSFNSVQHNYKFYNFQCLHVVAYFVWWLKRWVGGGEGRSFILQLSSVENQPMQRCL